MADNFFGITDTGRVRTNNEDAFIAQKLGRYTAACVIDGVGGYEGGEVAAAITRDAIIDYLSVPSGDALTMMREAFVVANGRIAKAKETNEQHAEMACVVTLALVDVAAKTFYYAHIGDTRLYLFRDGSLVKITKDQSFVGYLEDSGRLSEMEAMQHPKRNEINAALGFEKQLAVKNIEFGESPFLPGDMLLLCSDGLSDLVNSSDMTALLRNGISLSEKATLLVQAANAQGGKDNITVVLVRNHRKAVAQKALKPLPGAVSVKSVDQDQSPKSNPPQRKIRSNKLIFWIAAVVILIGTGAFLYFNNSTGRKSSIASVFETADSTELQLRQLLDTTKKGLVKWPDTVQALPVVLTDTVLVRGDSVHLQGGGMRILKSSSYNGPAFGVSDGCRYVLLENLSFENFDVALSVPAHVLHIKNVRFVGCRTPIVARIPVTDNVPVSGTVIGLLQSDSLHH